MLAYISAPFRNEDPAVIERNIKRAEEYGAIIHQMANHVTPVVVHTKIRDKWGIGVANVHGGPVDEEIIKFNLELLAQCDMVYVCGDVVTVGMQGEQDFAVEHKIPVVRVQSMWFEDAKNILAVTGTII